MTEEKLGRSVVGVRQDVVKEACAVAGRAHRSAGKPYVVAKHRGGGGGSPEVIFGFAGAWSVDHWYARRPFGESKIDPQLFPSLRSMVREEVAVVNDAFQRRFQELLAVSPLQSEVRKAVTENKQIVFTGHSSGGPIAVLATLWCLEQLVEPKANPCSPVCLTFGSPLIGNWIFSHALRRENWSDRFVHFVMRYDIVPRIFLAPLSSIERELPTILDSFNPNSGGSLSNIEAQEGIALYQAMLRNAASTSSHAACTLMGSTNMLLETVSNFVELSPYRPFGTHVFFTGDGKVVIVKNPDAVLQLFFYSSQLAPEAEAAEVAQRSLRDHFAYERELQDSLKIQNVVHLDCLTELPLSADVHADGQNVTISMALNDLGLSTRARLCLRAAGELEVEKKRNKEKIDKNKDKIKDGLDAVKGYQSKCEVRQVGYYDAFKLQKDVEDFHINVKRLELAGVWDEIIEMLKRNQLPEEFESRKEWVELGTKYRHLVEPLDIANYYRHGKNDDTGPYMKKGRPRRYKLTQRWLESLEKVPAGSCKESCFWAEVEELCIETSKRGLSDGGREITWVLDRDVQDSISKLEVDVLKWWRDGVIGKDVFLEESTFVKWWKKLPPHYKSGSCIPMLESTGNA